MPSRKLQVAIPFFLALLAVPALSSCGSTGATDASGVVKAGGGLAVVASFYPLQFATEQIGGEHVDVTSLTKPGAEPHDIELTPRDVAAVSKATLVVYQKGLQGAVDQAVESEGGNHSLDVAPVAHLTLVFQRTVGAAEQTSAANAAGTTDPHFWLDPLRYSGVAQAIAERLSSIDPAHKGDYAKNAKAFEDRLAALGAEFTAGLAGCQRKDIVTSHAAFGYLAERFGLRQVAINGLSPDQEPRAADLATVSTYARAHGVTTIYAETLVSPAIARAVATEAGATMATLDPIEGLTNQSRGADYFAVMRSNLKALQAGQGCS